MQQTSAVAERLCVYRITSRRGLNFEILHCGLSLEQRHTRREFACAFEKFGIRPSTLFEIAHRDKAVVVVRRQIAQTEAALLIHPRRAHESRSERPLR